MAGLDAEPLKPRADPHDGVATCCVCTTADAEAEHDWCAATSGLVCRSCCQRLLLDDVGRLMAISMGAAPPAETPEALGACAECERGRRWFAQHVLGYMTQGSAPS